jgi:hypothetical protein
MDRFVSRSLSLFLAILILTFTVGIPVVKYLCPLMSDENPHCSMCLHAPDGVESILPPVSSCCASHMIAERNTTPFLRSDAPVPVPLEASLFVVLFPALPLDCRVADRTCSHDPPLTASEPLFLQHSSLLI